MRWGSRPGNRLLSTGTMVRHPDEPGNTQDWGRRNKQKKKKIRQASLLSYQQRSCQLWKATILSTQVWNMECYTPNQHTRLWRVSDSWEEFFVFLGEGDEDDPGWDLAILASCHHLIHTYGTFGYMAAWFKDPGNGHLDTGLPLENFQLPCQAIQMSNVMAILPRFWFFKKILKLKKTMKLPLFFFNFATFFLNDPKFFSWQFLQRVSLKNFKIATKHGDCHVSNLT